MSDRRKLIVEAWGGSVVPKVIALVVSWTVMAFVAGWADVPTFQGDVAGVLTQPGAVLNVLAVALGLVVCVGLSVLICGGGKATGAAEVGWACGVAGLVAVVFRGGSVELDLLGRGSAAAVALLIELGVWLLIVAGLWVAATRLDAARRCRGQLQRSPHRVLVAIESHVCLSPCGEPCSTPTMPRRAIRVSL